MAEQKQDDQHEYTFSSYVRIRDVVLKTCLRRWTIGRSGERGSGISVLPAWHDDNDDDICWHIVYLHIYLLIYHLSKHIFTQVLFIYTCVYTCIIYLLIYLHIYYLSSRTPTHILLMYIYVTMYIIYRAIGQMGRVFANGLVESYQRLKKWYLMPPCLALIIKR